MASILEFFSKYLIIFIILSILLIFALIGYFVENGFRGKPILKKITVDKPTEKPDEMEELKSSITVQENQSLNDIVKNTVQNRTVLNESTPETLSSSDQLGNQFTVNNQITNPGSNQPVNPNNNL